jgi:CheY-like chemotaxis protein
VSEVGRDHFDLIFMDIIMPHLDGVSATMYIRQHYPSVPIIAMTSNIRPEEVNGYFDHGKFSRVDGVKAGADDICRNERCLGQAFHAGGHAEGGPVALGTSFEESRAVGRAVHDWRHSVVHARRRAAAPNQVRLAHSSVWRDRGDVVSGTNGTEFCPEQRHRDGVRHDEWRTVQYAADDEQQGELFDDGGRRFSDLGSRQPAGEATEAQRDARLHVDMELG